MKKSLLSAFGLVVLGWGVQLLVGPFDYSLLRWPANIMIIGIIALLSVAMAMFADRRMVKCLTSVPMAISLIVALCTLGLFMGLTPQGARPVGGSALVAARLGFSAMTTSWAFVLVWGALLVVLGGVVARRLANFHWNDLGFYAAHVGLWLALAAGGLGGADIDRMQIRVDEGTTVATPAGAITLHDFAMEHWPGGKPKRYASNIEVDGIAGVAEVNRPLRAGHWLIYQMGYDRSAGVDSAYSVLEIVRDRWLWVVYAGFAMIALGALWMIVGAIKRRGGNKKLWFGIVAAVGIVVAMMQPAFFSKNLVPALQSGWFVPHVAVYILSYALMSVATVGAIVGLCCDRGANFKLLDGTVYAGFGLLVVGMLMGAVWAKAAWGHYWEWDPKETWALVTGLAYLVYIHLRLLGAKYDRVALWVLVVAFAMLMITWKGVNYLPSAQGSVHVY